MLTQHAKALCPYVSMSGTRVIDVEAAVRRLIPESVCQLFPFMSVLQLGVLGRDDRAAIISKLS